MSFRLLLVEPDRLGASEAMSVLTDAGHRVAWVDSFADAVWVSASGAHDVMIAAIRLGAFNGLHLLMTTRAHTPDLPVVIACEACDFTDDIGRFGARHVAKPIDPLALRDVVSELLAGRSPHDPSGARIWPRKLAELSATVKNRMARIVELSYGGLRLNLERPPPSGPHAPIEIALPTLGVSVQALARWVKPAEDGASWWCGAEVALPTPDAARTWRWIVASVN